MQRRSQDTTTQPRCPALVTLPLSRIGWLVHASPPSSDPQHLLPSPPPRGWPCLRAEDSSHSRAPPQPGGSTCAHALPAHLLRPVASLCSHSGPFLHCLHATPTTSCLLQQVAPAILPSLSFVLFFLPLLDFTLWLITNLL